MRVTASLTNGVIAPVPGDASVSGPFRVLEGSGTRYFVVDGDIFETTSRDLAQRYADDMNRAGGAMGYTAQAFARDPSLRDRIAQYVRVYQNP